MKNFVLKSSLFAFLFTALLSAKAGQVTVSNDPNRVAQYNSVQEAIDDAQNGDTLLVYGSNTSYGNISIYKPIVLIGEGYNENLSLTTKFANINYQRFNSTLSASGSTLIGVSTSSVRLDAGYTGDSDGLRNLDDITVMRSQVDNIYIGYYTSSSESFDNIVFVNCLIGTNIGFQYQSAEDVQDVTFSNCIFDGVTVSSGLSRTSGVLDGYEDLSDVKFYNNLFLAWESGMLYNTVGLVFEDNIFFGHELYTTADYAQITWNNNLFYLTDQLPFDDASKENVGSGNLENTNPLFTDYPATPAAFSYDHDYTLQAGSPALTASVDGGEIGIYGGAYPFEIGAQPPVPQIIEITIQDGTSSVPQGGTINFNFKAKSGN